jgi:hypothetical protein
MKPTDYPLGAAPFDLGRPQKLPPTVARERCHRWRSCKKAIAGQMLEQLRTGRAAREAHVLQHACFRVVQVQADPVSSVDEDDVATAVPAGFVGVLDPIAQGRCFRTAARRRDRGCRRIAAAPDPSSCGEVHAPRRRDGNLPPNVRRDGNLPPKVRRDGNLPPKVRRGATGVHGGSGVSSLMRWRSAGWMGIIRMMCPFCLIVGEK